MNMSRACIVTALALAAGIGSQVHAGETAEPINSAAATQDELDDVAIKRITKGYSRAKRSDADYYCRIETPMGTRLGSKVCYTLDQLWAMERTRAEDRRKIEQMQQQRPLEGN